MVGESVLERHDDHIVLNAGENVDLVAVEVLRAVAGWRWREDVNLGELSVDGQVVPTLVDFVVGLVFHHDINGHVTGFRTRQDAEVVGVERAQLWVVSIVVQQGQRLVFTGQDTSVGGGDSNGGRGAQVLVHLNPQGVLASDQRGAVVEDALVVKDRQLALWKQRVFGHLEGVSTKASKDFVVEVAPFIGDGHGVPNVAVNVGWNVKFSGHGVADDKGRIDVLENGFPTVASDGGNIVFIDAEGVAVVAPNGVGFVVLVLVEPLKTDEVHRTDGIGVLDAGRVRCSCVFKGHLEVVLNQTGVVIGAVDVAVERFRGHEVKRVGSVFVIGHVSVEVAHAVADRTKVHHRLILNELGTRYAVGGVPYVVDLSLNAELVVPCNTGCSVAEEFSMNVGGFSHPTVEGVFFDGVGTGITGRVGVDHARGVHGHNAIVGIAKEALRHFDFVGVDAFEDAFHEQRYVVAENGGEGLVGTVHTIGFIGLCSDIAPRDGGGAGAGLGVGRELSREQDGLVGWSVVLHHGFSQGVLTDEADVLVIFSGFGVVGQEVGDGVVAASLCVRGDVHHVGRVGGVENRNGGFFGNEVGAQLTGDLVVRTPNANLERIGARGGENGIDGVVIQPVEGGLTVGSVKER